MKSMEDTLYVIKSLMGEKNVTNIYYLSQRSNLHGGIANIECLNAIVYRQYSNKSLPMFGRYVDFKPHRKSLKGIEAPSNSELERLGFSNINVAMANTIEALENRPSSSNPQLSKEAIVGLVEQTIEKETKRLKVELKEEIGDLNKEIMDEVGGMLQDMKEVQNKLLLAPTGMQSLTSKYLPTPGDSQNVD